MFGGLSVYVNGQLIACLMEDETDFAWKGKRYDYAIWNGLLIATKHEDHESLIKDIPELVEHPVLKKWLYLPNLDETDFRYSVKKIVKMIHKKDPRIGVTPKQRKRRHK